MFSLVTFSGIRNYKKLSECGNIFRLENWFLWGGGGGGGKYKKIFR